MKELPEGFSRVGYDEEESNDSTVSPMLKGSDTGLPAGFARVDYDAAPELGKEDRSATDASIKASGGDTLTGLKRGLQNLHAMGYGATALAGKGIEKIGLESIGQSAQDIGREGYRRNVEEAKQFPKRYSFKDVYTGEAGVGGTIDWVQGTLGELVPTMAEAAVGALVGASAGSAVPGAGTIGGGVVGGFAGRTVLKKAISTGVKQAMKKGIGNKTEAQVRAQVTKQAMKKLGSKVGMGAAVMPMESGGMYAELLEEKGIDAPETALFFGALATSMEFFGGNSKLIDTFVDALSSGSKGMAKKTAKELMINMPQEALQEGGQEALGILNKVVNTDEEFFTAENMEQIIEGMGAGLVGGGAGAVVSGTMNAQTDGVVDSVSEKFENIKSLGADKIPASIAELNRKIIQNNQLLESKENLEALAAEAGMEPNEMTEYISRQNELSQELKTRLQAELDTPGQVPTDQVVVEPKSAEDIDDLIAQKQAEDAAQVIRENQQMQALDERIENIRNVYLQITDPDRRKVVGNRLTALVNEKKALMEGTVAPDQPFKATPQIPIDEKQALYDQLFDSREITKDAQVSADVIATQSTEETDAQVMKEQAQDRVDQVSQESTDRQALYEGLFPETKSAQEAFDTFDPANELMTQKGAPYKNKTVLENIIAERAYPENYGIIEVEGGFVGYKKTDSTPEMRAEKKRLVIDEASTFKSEQPLEQVAPVAQPSQVEQDLQVNEQQLDALVEEINNTPDAEAQLALRQEGAALYEQNTLLKDQLAKQVQEDVTIADAGAESTFGDIFADETLDDEALTWDGIRKAEVTETTLHDTLIDIKQDEGLTGLLAEFMSQFIPDSKLDIPVFIDPNARSASYNRNKGITLRDPSQLHTSLHEIVHAVTVREMVANPEIKAKVTALMNIVAEEATKAAHLTPAQVKDIQAAGNSKAFKNRFPEGSEIDQVAQLGYSLLNEKEFLSQAFSSKQVQGFMQSIQIKDQDTGTFMTLWDKFISLIMNSLGIPKTKNTAFGEALKLTAELAQAEIPNASQATSIRASVGEEALAEGAEQVPQKISEAQYQKSFNQKNNILQSIGQTLKIRGKDFMMLSDKLLGSISTRLGNVSPLLKAKMRQLDFDTSQKIIDALHKAKPLLDKTREMSPADKHAWDLARKNSDEGKIQQIAQRYGMLEDQEKLRDTMNQLRQDAIDVGYDVGFVDEYWPRIIKDQEGFLQATQGISEDPVFSNAIKQRATDMGIPVAQFSREFPEIKADIISNLILGRNLGIGGPGNIQGRVYETIPEHLEKFYMNSDAALMQYIYSMTKKIEARKFFGKVPPKIAAHKTAMTKAQAELIKLEALAKQPQENAEVAQVFSDRITQLNDSIALHNEALDKYKGQRDYTENIGAYIDELMISGELHKKDERVVRDILEARFNEHGTTGIVNTYKNLAYIDVMGNPISALTQIGDLAWAAYVGKAWTPKGFSNTVKNAINATLGKSKITKEDLGLERIAQEFADGTTLGNAVSGVFKAVGLTKMDSIGKETLINNALMNYQNQIKTDAGRKALEKKIRPIFGIKTAQVIQDLAAGNTTDNIKLLLYSRLLDFQPAALSEMPEMYLKGGNGRVFYMLKTYTLKQMDVFRNEVFQDIQSKDPKRIVQGVKNMTALLSMLTLANAGADELKDLVLGKEVKFKDNVIENFLSIGGASRYMQMQVTQEGVGSALTQKILPPTKFINAASQDIRERIVTGDVAEGGRLLESIPGIGKLAYWHFGKGDANKKTIEEQDFKKAGKKIRKFKKQFEKAEDKRLFLQANSGEFKQMKLHENFQSVLNENKADMNKLEKLEQTPAVTTRLGQLAERRRLILTGYFEAAEKLRS